MQRKTTKLIAAGAAIVTVAVVGAGAVSASSDDDGTEVPITGEALEKASAAALSHLGGGKVTDTEVGDQEGYYEVEVTLDDGSQVDVHLSEDFTVIGSEPDVADDETVDDDGSEET